MHKHILFEWKAGMLLFIYFTYEGRYSGFKSILMNIVILWFYCELCLYYCICYQCCVHLFTCSSPQPHSEGFLGLEYLYSSLHLNWLSDWTELNWTVFKPTCVLFPFGSLLLPFSAPCFRQSTPHSKDLPVPHAWTAFSF